MLKRRKFTIGSHEWHARPALKPKQTPTTKDEVHGFPDGRTLKVSGFKPQTPDEYISLFFDSKAGRGGGNVVAVDRSAECDVAYVTFVDKEGCIRVSNISA